MPRLGLRLWLRKAKNSVWRKAHSFFKKSAGFFTFIIAVVGVYFAWKSVDLTERDTSQQAQINQLQDVLCELRIQNLKQDEHLDSVARQIKILTEIAVGTNIQNRLIQEDLAEAKVISTSATRQLQIATRRMERLNKRDSFDFQMGKFILTKTIAEVQDSVAINRLMPLGPLMAIRNDTIYEREINMLRRLKAIVDGELANPYFLKDRKMQKQWSDLGVEIGRILFTPQTYSSTAEDRDKTYDSIIKLMSSVSDISNTLNKP